MLELCLSGEAKTRNYFWALSLVLGSVALGDDPENRTEKPAIKASASDSTTWRLCLQHPSEWKMPGKLSEEKRAAWVATQQEAIRAQAEIEAEAAMYSSRELQLKAGSVPKDLNEKSMVVKLQRMKTQEETDRLKHLIQQRDEQMKIFEEELKAKIRRLQHLEQREA